MRRFCIRTFPEPQKYLHNTQTFSFHVTENATDHNYEEFNAIWENNACLLRESHDINALCGQNKSYNCHKMPCAVGS